MLCFHGSIYCWILFVVLLMVQTPMLRFCFGVTTQAQRPRARGATIAREAGQLICCSVCNSDSPLPLQRRFRLHGLTVFPIPPLEAFGVWTLLGCKINSTSKNIEHTPVNVRATQPAKSLVKPLRTAAT